MVYRKYVEFFATILIGVGMILLLSGMIWTLISAAAKVITG
jgi:hypothetical protein